MVARTLFCAALLLSLSLLSTQARALCRDDMHDFKPKMDRIKTTDPLRYNMALKWWGRAQEAEPGSEVECLNFLAEARKALSDPLPAPADCTTGNQNLPGCNGNGMGFIQVVPVGPVQAIGGAGTAPGATFNPPGSPGGGNQGTEATGTDR